MQPTSVRLKAASIAIEYERPRLAVTAVVPSSEDWIVRFDKAVEASNKIIEARRSEDGEWEADPPSQSAQRHLTGKPWPTMKG